MISELTFTNNSGVPEYRLVRDGVEIFRAKIALSYKGVSVAISKKGADYCVMDFTRLQGLGKQSNLNNPKRVMPLTIYNGIGQEVGEIKYAKGKGYSYFKCSVSEYLFDAYVVVLEKELLKISILSGGTQVALIEDNVPQPADGYAYKIASVDEVTAEMAALFGIFFDLNVYMPIGEFEFAKRDRRFDISENAELIKKYNVDFILNLDNSNFIGALEQQGRTAQLHTTEIDVSDIDMALRRPRGRAKKEAAESAGEAAPQNSDD